MVFFKQKNDNMSKRIDISIMITEASFIPRIDSFERLDKLIKDIEEKLDLKNLITDKGVQSQKGDSLTPKQMEIYSKLMRDIKHGDLFMVFSYIDEFIMENKGDISSLEKLCISLMLTELKHQSKVQQSENWVNILNNKPCLLNFEDREHSSNNVITEEGVRFLEHLNKIETKTINFAISTNNDISKQVQWNGACDIAKTINLKTDDKMNIFTTNFNQDEYDDKRQHLSYIFTVLDMIAECGDDKNIQNKDKYIIRKSMISEALHVMEKKYELSNMGYDKFIECLGEVKQSYDGVDKVVLDNVYNTFVKFKEENYFFTGNSSNYNQPSINMASISYFNIEIEDTKMQEVAIACILSQIWINTMLNRDYTMIPKHIVAFGVNNYKSEHLCNLYDTFSRRSRTRGNAMVTVVEWKNEQLNRAIKANNSYTF
jgi:hypothetical protein